MERTPSARATRHECPHDVTTMESFETVPREGRVRAVRRPLSAPRRLVPPSRRRRRDGPRDRLGGVHPALGPLDLHSEARSLLRHRGQSRPGPLAQAGERERRAVHRATAEAAVRPHTEQSDPSVRLLVQSLPERLRVPILLHYYADMPIREVSVLTGRKEGTIKADLHAARELFRTT